MRLRNAIGDVFKETVKRTKQGVLWALGWYEDDEYNTTCSKPNLSSDTPPTSNLATTADRPAESCPGTAEGAEYHTKLYSVEPSSWTSNSVWSPLSSDLRRARSLLSGLSDRSLSYSIRTADDHRSNAAVSLGLIDRDQLVSPRLGVAPRIGSGVADQSDNTSTMGAVLPSGGASLPMQPGAVRVRASSRVADSAESHQTRTQGEPVAEGNQPAGHGSQNTPPTGTELSPISRLMSNLELRAYEYKALYQNVSLESQKLQHERDTHYNHSTTLAELVKNLEQKNYSSISKGMQLQAKKQLLGIEQERLTASVRTLESALHREFSKAEELERTLKCVLNYTQRLEERIRAFEGT